MKSLAVAILAAGKPDSDSFMDVCTAKAMGVAPRWCDPYKCGTNSDCTSGAGCSVCWAGVAESDRRIHKSR